MKEILLICLLNVSVFAGEVDQFLAWNQLPNDASFQLNVIFNEEIQTALDDINEDHFDCSCEEAAGRILKHFGIGLNTPLEKRLKKSNLIDKYPTRDIPIHDRYARSIFKQELPYKNIEQYQHYSLQIQIDEVINVGGVYIGLDKITHFTASGYLYYRIYHLVLEQVHSEDAAIRMAISAGIYGEKNILGKLPSGVFSYADLESNYQGFRFAMDLCDNGTAYLSRTGKGWELKGQFDIRNYVNPNWDESYNPSFYYEGQNMTLMPKSQAVLNNIPHYCLKFQTDRIQEIFEYYDSKAEASFSMDYLKQLIEAEELPNPSPFDIRKICKE